MASFSISSGILKGLALKWNKSQTTRPTKSIVRESFFNTMASEIVDCVFIEGFAGCGSMGLEALSRGAKVGVFYELESLAFSVLEANLKSAKDRSAKLNIFAYNVDFFTLDVERLSETLRNKGLWDNRGAILYLDSPFNIRSGMSDIYERLITFIAALGRGGIRFVIFEHFSGYAMPSEIGAFKCFKSRTFGKSTLTYYALKD